MVMMAYGPMVKMETYMHVSCMHNCCNQGVATSAWNIKTNLPAIFITANLTLVSTFPDAFTRSIQLQRMRCTHFGSFLRVAISIPSLSDFRLANPLGVHSHSRSNQRTRNHSSSYRSLAKMCRPSLPQLPQAATV